MNDLHLSRISDPFFLRKVLFVLGIFSVVGVLLVSLAYGSSDALRMEGHYLAQIEQTPADYEPYKQLADHYFKRGKFNEAVPYYKSYLENKGVDANVLMSLAICQEQTGKYEEATQSYSQLISHFPDRPEVYLALGALYQKLGKQESAESFYQIYRKLRQ